MNTSFFKGTSTQSSYTKKTDSILTQWMLKCPKKNPFLVITCLWSERVRMKSKPLRDVCFMIRLGQMDGIVSSGKNSCLST